MLGRRERAAHAGCRLDRVLVAVRGTVEHHDVPLERRPGERAVLGVRGAPGEVDPVANRPGQLREDRCPKS